MVPVLESMSRCYSSQYKIYREATINSVSQIPCDLFEMILIDMYKMMLKNVILGYKKQNDVVSYFVKTITNKLIYVLKKTGYTSLIDLDYLFVYKLSQENKSLYSFCICIQEKKRVVCYLLVKVNMCYYFSSLNKLSCELAKHVIKYSNHEKGMNDTTLSVRKRLMICK